VKTEFSGVTTHYSGSEAAENIVFFTSRGLRNSKHKHKISYETMIKSTENSVIYFTRFMEIPQALFQRYINEN